jgi:murein DD-endopeptidase MepM/ murein hydrolase activator NlpD
MPFHKYIKKLKSFSVIFVPEGTSQRARSVKLSFNNIIWIGIIYTALMAVLGFYAFTLSGAGRYLLLEEKGLSDADRLKVEQLNTKMTFLVKELEKLKATNERFKYSLILGDSTLFDSLSQEDDDSTLLPDEPEYGGNILFIVKKLLVDFSYQDVEAPFFIKPVNGYVSRKFDSERGHLGIDFVVKVGVPVYASAGGYVVFSDYTVNDGYMIILNHIDGYITVYKHCSMLLKGVRESVELGELLAISGNTGKKTTGPHLHFEIWKNGKPLDPAKFVINY